MLMSINATTWLARRLGEYDVLTEEEKCALEQIIEHDHRVSENQDIVVEGSRPSHSILLIEGFCARYNLLPDGKRQITAIHIPGDFVDLHSFCLKRMDHSIAAITRCRVAAIPHRALREMTENHPHLARLLWTSTAVDGAILRQWLFGMGRRSALERMAHQICELFVRLKGVGLVEDESFQMPVTQAQLADILGISTVHVNRIAQELRGQGIITWRGATVVIEDWERLCQIAEFNPTYLNLQNGPR